MALKEKHLSGRDCCRVMLRICCCIVAQSLLQRFGKPAIGINWRTRALSTKCLFKNKFECPPTHWEIGKYRSHHYLESTPLPPPSFQSNQLVETKTIKNTMCHWPNILATCIGERRVPTKNIHSGELWKIPLHLIDKC